MKGLPPPPDEVTGNYSQAPVWEGLPELPPGFRWINFYGEPAIADETTERHPVGWINNVKSNVHPEKLGAYLVAQELPEGQGENLTPMEACSILAMKLWLGEVYEEV